MLRSVPVLILAAENGRIDINLDRHSKLLSKLFAHDSKTKFPQPDETLISPPDYAQSQAELPGPGLNIVIQIVGSRGDVQPFVSLGLALQQHGHRVRLATHATFKKFVEGRGLEFFSIGGDPAELMAYMVKNPGLIPKLATLRSGEIQKRRQVIYEIMNGCWRSCIETGDGLDMRNAKDEPAPKVKDFKPFIADAIIANPPSFAHIHCAERLGIPLHLMFTMPWSPTQKFPHPLANIRSSDTDMKIANFLSYILVDALTWQGLGDVISRFRRKTLHLGPIDPTWAPAMITRLKIPYTYCWSPKLIPKPRDWASHISVAGFFFLSGGALYSPSLELLSFITSGPPPIYIGFGSIVVDDPASLTELIFAAIRLAGIRAIVSKGWGSIGASLAIPRDVFMVNDCPHDWLFEHVSCVVHHGGAGTTAAGMALGKPTVVVPFFGDQPFWGDMIYQAGAGPRPILFPNLTAERLAEAITAALRPEVLENSRNLGEKIRLENGAEEGVRSFHRQLPVGEMRCQVAPERAAVWQLRKGKTIVRLSALAATVLRKAGLIEFGELKLHRPSAYNLDHGPWEPISGSTMSILDLFYETFKGIGEIGSEFIHVPYVGYKGKGKAKADQSQASFDADTDASSIQSPRPTVSSASLSEKANGKRNETVVGVRAAKGMGRIMKAAARAPMTFTVAMAQGSDNALRLMGDKTVRPQPKITGVGSGLAAAGKGFALNTYDGIVGLFMQPINGAREGGVLGGVAGLARGVIGVPLKWWSGGSGLIGYSLKGVDVQIKEVGKGRTKRGIKGSRMAQGEWEFTEVTEEVRRDVLDRWRRLELSRIEEED